jgi:coniferyl-aldehyde dehydrogenase
MISISDLSTHTGNVYRQLVENAFPNSAHGVRVVEIITGGLALFRACGSLTWYHLLYTGGTTGAKAVMPACAENLVPLTADLGGKCSAILGIKQFAEDPTVIDEIMGTRMIKNGQMCMSVDYVMISDVSQAALLHRHESPLIRWRPKHAPATQTRRPLSPMAMQTASLV